MRIGYSDVEAVVRAIHGSGAKPTALLGRLKYLQRFDWPPGGAKGQGSRAGYGLEQLLAVMLAFELLELGLPPVRVVRLLRTGWDQTIKTLLLGWAAAFEGGKPVFLVLSPSALEELGVPEDAERSSPDQLRPAASAWLDGWRDEFQKASSALYLVDPRRIAAAARTELGELAIVTVEETDRAFVDLGAKLFGVDEPTIWSLGDEVLT